MHHAPSVTYPVGRSHFYAGLLLFFWLLGVVLVGWWCWSVDAIGWRQWLAVLVVPCVAACAWHSWRFMLIGELRWDGQTWLVIRPGQGGTEAEPAMLSVHLDLQAHLLLRLCQENGLVAWCWAERASQPERWSDLRRAVYSRARSQAVPDDAPPPSIKPAAPASPET